MQLLAFADDIDIIAQTPTTLTQAFLSLEKDELRKGLRINEKSTSLTSSKLKKFHSGHVVRMDEDCITKKFFNAQPTGTWRKGRPNLRCIDDLKKDLVLSTKNWRTLAGRRLVWKRLLKKIKAHPGLSSH
ncbi:uncharacterized protein TNCV_84821 [Trichonephila clavipes]|nr:uncharacterized protein TNCV_84821 [Trichonephila clavipes]